MAKHPYNPDCDCERCTRERARRAAQCRSDCDRRVSINGRYHHTARKTRERKPEYGSAEWAETYADDLGESID